jgi:L-ascorbate metabolism protein UlaG (beta-lactamase superfamily)
MRLTWPHHSAFRIEACAAKILVDPFLSDNPSWDRRWSGYLAGKNSTQRGDRSRRLWRRIRLREWPG